MGLGTESAVDLYASPARKVLAAPPRGDDGSCGGKAAQGRQVGVVIVEVGKKNDLRHVAVEQVC
jgi:hypothetical protein